MKQALLAATAMAALTLASCKKKNDDATNSGGSTPTLRLKKMIQGSGSSAKIVLFSYDNAGRLSGFASTDNSSHTSFAYDNNGNLSTIDETEDEYHNVYTYNYIQGAPATALFKSWKITAGQPNELVEDDELTYTVANNRVTNIHLNMTQSATEMDFALSYDANGELIQAKTAGTDFYTATFSYGTHKSAYPRVSNWVLDQAGFSLLYYTRRDLQGLAYDFPGTALDKSETITYTFNSSGYPASSMQGGVLTTYEYE